MGGSGVRIEGFNMNNQNLKPLQKGEKIGRGGKREGAGRKPDAFKQKCAELAENPKFFEWAKTVLEGDYQETKVTKEGAVINIPVSVYDRKELWKDLAAYGFGKPVQTTELTGENGGPLKVNLVKYA